MHSVIIVVERPEAPVTVAQKWEPFRRNAMPAEEREGVEKLGKNCWQLTLGKAAKSLADFSHHAQTSGLTYRQLFFEDAPQWVLSKPAATK